MARPKTRTLRHELRLTPAEKESCSAQLESEWGLTSQLRSPWRRCPGACIYLSLYACKSAAAASFLVW